MEDKIKNRIMVEGLSKIVKLELNDTSSIENLASMVEHLQSIAKGILKKVGV